MSLVADTPATAFPPESGERPRTRRPHGPSPIAPNTAPPNVLFRAIDDVGYGQMAPFGGLGSGTIPTVTLDVSGEVIQDAAAELRMLMAQQ